nr:unnamed protein product [uncultured bacterium]
MSNLMSAEELTQKQVISFIENDGGKLVYQEKTYEVYEFEQRDFLEFTGEKIKDSMILHTFYVVLSRSEGLGNVRYESLVLSEEEAKNAIKRFEIYAKSQQNK